MQRGRPPPRVVAGTGLAPAILSWAGHGRGEEGSGRCWLTTTVSRRSVLGIGAAALASAALAACGGAASPTAAPAKPAAPAEPTKPAAAAAPTTAPAAAPTTAAAAGAATKPAAAAANDCAGRRRDHSVGGGRPERRPGRRRRQAGRERQADLGYLPGRRHPLARGPHQGVPGRDARLDRRDSGQSRCRAACRLRPTPKMYAMYASGTLGDVFAFDPSHWEFYRAVPKGLLRPIDDFVKDDKYDVSHSPVHRDAEVAGQDVGPAELGLVWPGWLDLQRGPLAGSRHQAARPRRSQVDMDAIRDMAKKLTKMSAGGAYDRYGTSLALGAAGATVYVRAYDNPDFYDEQEVVDPRPERDQGLQVGPGHGPDRQVGRAAGRLPGLVCRPDGLGQALDPAGRLAERVQRPEGDQGREGGRSCARRSFPKRKDGKRPAQLRGGTWNIGSKSKNPEAGWKFIQTLSDHDGTLKFNTIGGNGALVRPDVMNDPYFSHPGFDRTSRTC